MKALVLACGNSLRGDDGVALQIVHRMQEGVCDPATEFHCQQQWTPELAEPISKAKLVVFVDAALHTPPGSIACRQLQPMRSMPLGYTHHVSPESLLWLAEELYGKRPVDAYLITIAGATFKLAEPLSDPVQSAIPSAVQRINALLSLCRVE